MSFPVSFADVLLLSVLFSFAIFFLLAVSFFYCHGAVDAELHLAGGYNAVSFISCCPWISVLSSN